MLDWAVWAWTRIRHGSEKLTLRVIQLAPKPVQLGLRRNRHGVAVVDPEDLARELLL